MPTRQFPVEELLRLEVWVLKNKCEKWPQVGYFDVPDRQILYKKSCALNWVVVQCEVPFLELFISMVDWGHELLASETLKIRLLCWTRDKKSSEIDLAFKWVWLQQSPRLLRDLAGSNGRCTNLSHRLLKWAWEPRNNRGRGEAEKKKTFWSRRWLIKSRPIKWLFSHADYKPSCSALQTHP